MKRLWAIAIIKDIKKPTQSKQKKFRDFNPDWLLMIKINAGMLPLPNWAIARLYKVTGFQEFQIDLSKKQRYVSSKMHISKIEFKIYYIQYQINIES